MRNAAVCHGFARSGEAMTKPHNSMFYVYFLKSLANNDLYIGSTEDVAKRLVLHNAGKVRSTKAYRPWQLMGHEEYNSRSEAVRRERFLKSHQQKDLLKKRFENE